MAKGSAFSKPLKLSEELQEFLGTKKASRGEVIKGVWAHIKKKKLNDGRTINPDDKMKPLFGKKPFDMMQIAKKLKGHILKD